MTPASAPARTPLLTERQLGEWFGVSAHSIAHRRVNGSGPPFVTIGGSVRYDEAVVRDWLRANTRTKGSNRKSRRGKKDKTSSAEASAPLAGGGTGEPGANEKTLTSASRQGLADPTHRSILPSRKGEGLAALRSLSE